MDGTEKSNSKKKTKFNERDITMEKEKKLTIEDIIIRSVKRYTAEPLLNIDNDFVRGFNSALRNVASLINAAETADIRQKEQVEIFKNENKINKGE